MCSISMAGADCSGKNVIKILTLFDLYPFQRYIYTVSTPDGIRFIRRLVRKGKGGDDEGFVRYIQGKAFGELF